MNERYLFRGKDMAKRWVKGFLAADNIIVTDRNAKIIVKPETIGQSTNIKDKNKNLIFDGDVIKYTNSIGTEIFAVVNWSIGCYSCRIVLPTYLNNNNPSIDIILNETNGNIEVIGNVHDNPEFTIL